MSSLFNLRDLGGHPIDGGGAVRTGAVYRGGSVHRSGGESLPRIRTLIDLRTPKELATEGECPAFHGATVMHRPVLAEVWRKPANLDDLPIDGFLAERYLDMLESGASALHDVICTLAREEHLPVLFFCAAGKDRTGVVGATILSILGVRDEAIASDYVLSEEPVRAMAEQLRQAPGGASSAVALATSQFLQAPRAAMLLFLQRLREVHGSMLNYALSTGVDRGIIDAVRERLTVV